MSSWSEDVSEAELILTEVFVALDILGGRGKGEFLSFSDVGGFVASVPPWALSLGGHWADCLSMSSFPAVQTKVGSEQAGVNFCIPSLK